MGLSPPSALTVGTWGLDGRSWTLHSLQYGVPGPRSLVWEDREKLMLFQLPASAPVASVAGVMMIPRFPAKTVKKSWIL